MMNLTVGELKKIIEDNNLSDDAIIYISCTTDEFMKGVRSDIIRHQFSDSQYQIMDSIKKVKSGYYDDKEQFPGMTDEIKQEYLDMEQYFQEGDDAYIPAVWAFKDKDDKNLFISVYD